MDSSQMKFWKSHIDTVSEQCYSKITDTVSE